MATDIWIQPTEKFNEQTIGRTEQQILNKEAQIGFKYPKLYREHMKIQNGGYLRNQSLKTLSDDSELFCNGSSIDGIFENSEDNTLKDQLLTFLDIEEIQELNPFLNNQFMNLDRLPILSKMDGHRILCFDYGYNVEHSYEKPKICLFDLECCDMDEGFEETLRFDSYEELIDNLVYYGYESVGFYFGFYSDDSIKNIANHFSTSPLNINLERKTDNNYGWFNFKEYYSGHINLNSEITMSITLTPNKFVSGNSLFQNHINSNYIVNIVLENDAGDLYDNSDYLRNVITEKLEPFSNKYNNSCILSPFNKINLEQLENLKALFEN